jgi:hypothetical protein
MEIALTILVALVVLVVLITYLYGVYRINKIKKTIGEKAGKEVIDVLVKLTEEKLKYKNRK